MGCPKCGAPMSQGPSGGWQCGNCGETRVNPPALRELTLSSCYQCGTEVVDGPNGGYCCGLCGHVVEPLANLV